MMRDPLRFVLVTVLGLSLWAPPPVARATQVLSKSAPAGLSPAPWLNLDGTLTVTEPAFGALDLAGYNVTVDASRGPIFSPETDSAAAVAPGQWDAIGTGLGALTGRRSLVEILLDPVGALGHCPLDRRAGLPPDDADDDEERGRTAEHLSDVVGKPVAVAFGGEQQCELGHSCLLYTSDAADE